MLYQLFCLEVYVVVGELDGHVLVTELTIFVFKRVNGSSLTLLDCLFKRLLLRFCFDWQGLI